VSYTLSVNAVLLLSAAMLSAVAGQADSGLIPAPKAVLTPLDRPQLSFLKRMGFGLDEYSNVYQLERVKGGIETWIYPSWHYSADVNWQSVAHELKARLKKSNGWSIEFPDMKNPYSARATHRLNGHVDLEFKVVTANPGPKYCIWFSDPSVILKHSVEPLPPK
jgi:hypothetical protein